jgi:hypothetical protein
LPGIGSSTNAAVVSGKLESDANFRARLAARDDSAWLTEHDVEAVFRNALKAGLEEGTVGACLPVVPLDLHLFESARLWQGTRSANQSSIPASCIIQVYITSAFHPSMHLSMAIKPANAPTRFY